MTGRITVSFGLLDAAVADLGQGAEGMQQRMQQLRSDIAPMLSTWSGSAQQSYLVAQLRWYRSWQELTRALQDLQRATGAANEGYDAGERANAARFGGPAGAAFDASPGAIEDAAAPLDTADAKLQTFGDAVKAAAAEAAAGAGEGPLAGALDAFGADGQERAGERGDECHELAQALRESAEEYRSRDGAARSGFDAVRVGG